MQASFFMKRTKADLRTDLSYRHLEDLMQDLIYGPALECYKIGVLVRLPTSLTRTVSGSDAFI